MKQFYSFPIDMELHCFIKSHGGRRLFWVGLLQIGRNHQVNQMIIKHHAPGIRMADQPGTFRP